MESYDNTNKKKFFESFGKISKDISLEKLTFKQSNLKSQNYLKQFEVLKDKKKINYGYYLLEKAYKFDNTNLDIIEKFIQIKPFINPEESSDNKKILDNINDIIKLYEPIINTTKESQIEKIFDLIDILTNYNVDSIDDKYKIEKYLIDFFNSNKIGIDFNTEISSDNEKLYIYTIYYSWVTKILKIFENYNKENNNEEQIIELEENKNDIEIFLEKRKFEIISSIKKLLNIEEKINIDEKDLKIIIDKEINKELAKNYDSNTNTFIKNKKINELEILVEKLEKNNHCLLSIYNYFNHFYTRYLYRLQIFLKNIPQTLSYLKNLDYNKKQNIKILRDFIFFLSYFSFLNGKSQFFINYYETTFKLFEINENLKIIGKDLYCPIERIKIKNYENYNLNCYDLNNMDENRFLYEGYIKFNLFHEKNLFYKNKDVYKDFFKILFLNDKSIIKKIFLNTFPVLQDNYFIDNDFLEYIFNEKINSFNFINNDFIGITITSNLDIFIKGNYSNNKDTIENEISIFAAFIIIILHEISHFIRIYIYKHLGVEEYEKSFSYDENEEPEIGKFIEKKLFGRVIEKINILETLYILNINNYFKDNCEKFLFDFEEIKNQKSIDVIDDNVKNFLEKLGFDLNKNIKFNLKNDFILKGSSNCLNIGMNNDKGESREAILELYKYMNEKYKNFIKK